MRQLDKRTRLTRRRFLQTTSVTAVGVGALATGRVLIDPRGAWAMSLTTLSAEAAKDAALKDLLTEGTADLDRQAAAKGAQSYADLPNEADRVAILKAISGTPFFKKLRGDMISALYNQPEVWAKLGYEGPSAPKGGYLHRGFNDLDWLK